MPLFTVTWDETLLPAWYQRMDAAVGETTMDQSRVMAQFAKDTVNVETGSLQDTIAAEPLADAPGLHEWVVIAGDESGGYKGGGLTDKAAGTPVDYAAAQEYGGHGAHKPYMTPASEQGFINLVLAMTKAIGGVI